MKKEILHEKLEFSTVAELVEWAGDTHGDKCAYSYRQSALVKDITKVTFNQFRQNVKDLACQLTHMGCRGKHCAVVGKLSYEWAMLYFAALSIGAVLVPLDKDWQGADLAATAKTADVRFLFCDEDIADKAELISKEAELEAEPVYMLAKENERNVRTMQAIGHMRYAKDSSAWKDPCLDPDSPALMVFTSGTTGKGKGVVLSQRCILSDITSVIPYIDFSEKTIGVLPPHHTYGSTVMFLGHAIIGAEVYISSGLKYITKELKEQKPGHLILVPLYLESFYRKILATVRDQGKEDILNNTIKMSKALRKTGIDMRKKLFTSVRAAFGGELRTVISGGAPINPDIIAFFDAIGISTLNGYGITECSPIVAVNRSRRIVEGSVGNVLDVNTVKIDSPNENGEGEILVKGANVMLGYYKDDKSTADAFDCDGYFRTGDYGKLENGILYITGRKKNLIILSNGKNVYPEEIETELMAVPGVLEVVVYEGQSKRGLERNEIVAEIFPDKDYCEKNGITDVKAHLKSYVDAYNKTAVPYKKITLIRVRKEEFPKNTLRKIQRFKLDTTID